MNDINKLKELAVPVSERLPEKSNTYTCICDNQLCYLFFAKSNKTWGLDWSKKDYGVTHWIDFDLLTTKAKALELAELAWVGGHKYCEEGRSGQNYYNFLTENQSKL